MISLVSALVSNGSNSVVPPLRIGASFIIKKKGLKRAGSSGVRAGSGGYGYLQEPLWWMGMVTMIVGEVSQKRAAGGRWRGRC
jgi:hypothetical protein